MGETNQTYRLLIEKHVAGETSAEEVVVLDAWLRKSQSNKQLFKKYKQEAEARLILTAEDDWNRFADKYNMKVKKPDNKRLIIALSSIAAAITIVVGLSFQSLNSTYDEYSSLKTENPETVKSTTLHLADGQSLTINERHALLASDEEGIHFVEDNKEHTENIETTQSNLNTIQVPYGRTAQLTLDDGTRVWLNAGSQLIFPIHFNDVDKREVMLVGEGYFDVSHDKDKPFMVLTDEMTYTVLGTSFNIRSYNNSRVVSAVLTEGSLKVERNTTFNKQQTILKPGQKCSYHVNEGRLQVNRVNAAIYSSWKDGYLTLDKNNIRMLARQMEQFYNCDINVCRELQDMPMQLSGKLLLDENVEQVCMALCDLTGVDYKIENNQIEFYIQK
ncbi:FecR family protein [Carboxylicivirga sp. RSCT41]|uniref:FecR family protein n=1 Tax=Carboxylicivirga agarovorans TaxID=3417570 RepID=UPI003D328319